MNIAGTALCIREGLGLLIVCQFVRGVGYEDFDGAIRDVVRRC